MSVNGTISYLVTDEQGSVDEALSSSGSATAAQIFFPYGTVRYQSGTMPTSYGYTGQRADPSGLLYYGARYYDPTVGQFTSVDTVQGPNRYAYVGGNPTTLTDPSGQFAGSGQLFVDEGTNSCGIFVNTGSGCSFGTPVGSPPLTLGSSPGLLASGVIALAGVRGRIEAASRLAERGDRKAGPRGRGSPGGQRVLAGRSRAATKRAWGGTPDRLGPDCRIA